MHPAEVLSPRDVFGARVGAFLVDAFLVAVAAGPLADGAGWAMAAVFAVLYLGVLGGITGYSCGKAVLGVKVVRAGTTDAPGLVGGLIRAVIGLVELPLFVIAAVVAATNDRRRRVGDLAGRTEVVGISPSSGQTALYAAGYVALLAIFVATSSFTTFLIIWALAVPVAVAFAVVILGVRREAVAGLWLVAAGLTLVPGCYLAFSDLCKRGEGACGDMSADHRAIPALIVVAVGIAAFFVLRGAVARAALALLTTVGGVWMMLRLFDSADMKIGGILILIALTVAAAAEVLRYVARQRAARFEAAAPA